VDGDLTEVARLVPKDIRMMTWWNLKRVESLSYFNGLGFKTLGAAYYDTGNLDNTRTWLAELNRTSGAQGIMYTTWASNYKDLAGFGDLVGNPPPPDPRVQELRLEPAAVIGGATSAGNTVTLDAEAGVGGLDVKLASSDAAVATVPATLRVAEGTRSASFSIVTRAVADPATVEVSAATESGRSAAQLAVMPANLSEFDAGDQSLPKDQAVTATIRLDGPAPQAGAEISLTSSNNEVLPLPEKVVIPGGETSITFPYTRGVVSESVPVELYAVYRGAVKKVSLTVQP
jgi:hypothetical protein